MNVQRLLIADPSEAFADELAHRLGSAFHVQACTDGAAALSMLESFRPDMVVVDLMLAKLDGLALVRFINALPVQPKILVTTRLVTAYVESVLQEITVDYVMLKPCDFGIITDRIIEICGSRSGDIILPPHSVGHMLSALNLSVNHKGFQFLCYGIELYNTIPECAMSRDLYPAIARQYHTQPNTVERDIRLAIRAAWNSRNITVWNACFGNDCRPTNTTFISTLAARISYRKAM